MAAQVQPQCSAFGYNDLSVGRYEDVSSGSPADLPQPMDDIFPDFQLPGQRVLSKVHCLLLIRSRVP